MSFLSSLLNSYTNNNEDCDIIIKDSLGGSVTIPVLPSSFNVTVKQNNTTVNINNLNKSRVGSTFVGIFTGTITTGDGTVIVGG